MVDYEKLKNEHPELFENMTEERRQQVDNAGHAFVEFMNAICSMPRCIKGSENQEK